ncbi:MAG TPA: LCP family protein [Solirubrobacteraceae bacterium]|nr:LCP family protein [Solirubrobacteraceae bacterium]
MPRTRFGFLWRGVLALVLVVGCAAGATATAGLLQVKDAVGILNIGKSLDTKGITPPAAGQPETLLLIGVDHRYGEGSSPGNTDTMMLMRIDDSSSTINALSIPRDLEVTIPGVGADNKLNAAYADGGADGSHLLLETLKQNLFPDLKVNHILVTDFQSFANLITSIGCVYGPVDHRYYNHSIGAEDPTTDYSSIDIQPGYQKLCGNNGAADSALAFVRFRHNDSDLVRESRQQDFLEWAKGQFGASRLYSEKTALLKLFAKDVSSDHYLHTSVGLIDLFNLAFNANGASIKSIPFPVDGTVTTAGGADDLTYSQAAVEQAYQDLMTPTALPAGSNNTTPVTTTTKTKSPTRTRKHRPLGPPPAPKDMVADSGDGISQAAQLGPDVGLPVYYPRNIPDDFTYCFSLTGNCNIGYEPSAAYAGAYPRHYVIRDNAGKPYKSYVMTLVESSGDVADTATGQYFTVQGTTWTGANGQSAPPILTGSHTVRVVRGKTLEVYSQGGKVNLVAWHHGNAVYWISNTLQNAIPAYEMVSMAESFTPATH